MLSLTGWAKSTDHAAMDEELEAQAEAALDVIHAAVVRLLSDGGVSPQLAAPAAGRGAGEPGGGAGGGRAGRQRRGRGRARAGAGAGRAGRLHAPGRGNARDQGLNPGGL